MNDSDDLGSVFDAHVRAEFLARDIDATMATMTDAPYVTHVPVLTAGAGARTYGGSMPAILSVVGLRTRR